MSHDPSEQRPPSAEEFFGTEITKSWDEKFPQKPTDNDLQVIGEALDDFLGGNGNREIDRIAEELPIDDSLVSLNGDQEVEEFFSSPGVQSAEAVEGDGSIIENAELIESHGLEKDLKKKAA